MERDIKKVACLGAGLIGASWATLFLLKGYPVNIYDIKDEYLKAAQEQISRNLNFFWEKEIISSEAVERALKNASYTTSMELAVSGVQYIQESGPEKYEVKQQLLSEMEKFASPRAIFASSTSGLLISEIAKMSKYPERCLGAHPYNPPHLIPLVEISKGPQTSPEIVQLAYDFYKSLGKEPIILHKEALGFVANRLQAVLYREAVDLVVRGVCSVEDVDKACCYGPGLRYGIMGPNLIFQLGGGNMGIKGMMEKLVGPSFELWLPDVAKWEKIPEGWPDIAQEGINWEMSNRPPECGRTPEEIAKYRDNMLIEMLKLHNKL